MKHRPIPQFELPVAGEVFNLMVETARDGWKAATRKEQLERDRAECEKQQLGLFYEPESTH